MDEDAYNEKEFNYPCQVINNVKDPLCITEDTKQSLSQVSKNSYEDVFPPRQLQIRIVQWRPGMRIPYGKISLSNAELEYNRQAVKKEIKEELEELSDNALEKDVLGTSLKLKREQQSDSDNEAEENETKQFGFCNEDLYIKTEPKDNVNVDKTKIKYENDGCVNNINGNCDGNSSEESDIGSNKQKKLKNERSLDSSKVTKYKKVQRKVTGIKRKSHPCDVCKKLLSSVHSLAIHKRIHEGIKPYECEKCHHKFSDRSAYWRHIVIHTGNKTVECDICKKKFYFVSGLRIHMHKHTNERPYKCKICNKNFNYVSSYKMHLKVHENNNKIFQCEVCQKQFRHNNTLIEHQRVHTGEKPYKCGKCDKAFTKLTNLNTHNLSHTGIKPHKCDFCGKTFTQSCTLKIHVRRHTGEKPFKCDKCKSSFVDNSDFRRHPCLRPATKPYECNKCNKKFHFKNRLTSHSYIHTKPFFCKFKDCTQQFTSLPNLRSHLDSDHGNKRFICAYCNKEFVRKKTLANHIRLKHKIEFT